MISIVYFSLTGERKSKFASAAGPALLRHIALSASSFNRPGLPMVLRTRVAALSACFALACILLAAAPTISPCFRHWRQSKLLPPLGELSAKQTERATLFYHFLSQNSKNFGKAIDFMKLKCYAMSMLNHFTILKFAIRKHQRQGGLISPAVPEQEKENPP